MARTLHLRPLTAEERSQLCRQAQSRTAPARDVERARIIWLAHQGADATAISAQLGRCAAMVRKWLTRFNAAGMAGLAERRRPGCPGRYSPEQVSEVITGALTDPQQLGLPFGCWTLDRLQAYLNEVKRIASKRSRIDELLLAQGLRWRTQEGWLGVRVDPEFAAKRGRSPPSPPPLPEGVSPSAWRRGDRGVPAAIRAGNCCGPRPLTRPRRPRGLVRNAMPATTARAICLVPSDRRPGKRSPLRRIGERQNSGSPSWNRWKRGSTRPWNGFMPSSITCRPITPAMSCCSA